MNLNRMTLLRMTLIVLILCSALNTYVQVHMNSELRATVKKQMDVLDLQNTALKAVTRTMLEQRVALEHCKAVSE